MKLKKLIVIFLLFNSIFIFSQEKQVLEFNNKPIVDVLTVLADLSGKNIIPDESVTGLCSYYFTTDNMDEALELFLKSQDLFIFEMDNAFRVSKVFIEGKERITLKTTDTDIKLVLDRITSYTGVTVLYDNLPRARITLNIKELPLNVILEIIMKKYPEYTIDINDDYYYIKKESARRTSSVPNNNINKTNGITLDDNGRYSIKLNKVRFTQVVAELFSKEGFEYSIQGRNDNIIERIEHRDKTFNEMLTLILESGSCDYVKSNDIYYIFDINKTEVANKHIETKVIKLKNISAKELLKLMPGSFMSNNALKVDEDTNSVIVYGTKIKTSPIISFIELVDRESDKKPYWIEMDFVQGDLFKNILLKDYSANSIINVDKNSFLILLTKEEYKKVLHLKSQIDVPPKSYVINLKYIKSDQLLENLPKSVEQDQIIVTPNPSVIFYYGGDEGHRAFLKELTHIDKPVPQIKYKVLVLQNMLGDDSNIGIDFAGNSGNYTGDDGVARPEDGWNAFSGALGGLLGLNFNVISALGPLFSMKLNAAITNNKSKILVDTTLQALSGKKVSFRNTTTSRFYHPTTNADGTTENSGATQEVSWGILLDIEGWTSGDGIVTVNVQSTLSDETKVSGESSGIPSTSEKVVNTEVRTPEGIPVVIGGLLSSKKEKTVKKTPILGSIPFLGRLFNKEIERETQSEFVIYLLPYIDDFEKENVGLKLERAYKEYRN